MGRARGGDCHGRGSAAHDAGPDPEEHTGTEACLHSDTGTVLRCIFRLLSVPDALVFSKRFREQRIRLYLEFIQIDARLSRFLFPL